MLLGTYSLKTYCQLYKCNTLEDLDHWNTSNAAANGLITNLLFSSQQVSIMGKSLRSAISNTLFLLPSKQKHIWTDSLNVILVVGESYVKSHCGLYGYNLNTTPRLCREKSKGNLFVYEDVISCSYLTSSSMRNMLSCNSIGDKEQWYEKPYFPTIFNMAGYHVYFWDNQYVPSSGAGFDYSLNAYIHNHQLSLRTYSKTQKQVSLLDGDIVADFFNYAEREELAKQNLVIFHLQGQHNDQKKRYPQMPQYAKFSTDDIRRNEPWMSKKKKEVIMHYDNCTYYNDNIIGIIMDFFRNSNAIMVYLSDHGEDIYDTGNRFGRRLNLDMNNKSILKNLYEIPFVIWCSDKYKIAHPEIIAAIKNSLSKPMMTDNLCHLLMKLGGVTSDYYNDVRDPLSDKYICPPRIIEDGRDFDKIL